MSPPTGASTGPVRRFVNNLGSLLTSTVVERISRFVVYAAVARALGATSLGQLALSMAILQLVSRIAVLGIPLLAIREVARNRHTTRAYALRGGGLVIMSSAIGYLGVWVFASMTDYEPSTYTVIWTLLLGLVPYCWSRITEALLVGLEEARYVALINVPISVIQAGVAIALLSSGYEVSAVAASLAAAFLAMAILQGVAVASIVRGIESSPDPKASTVLRDGAPFLGLQATAVVRTTANTLIISVILGEAAVGLFSAAQQLQMPLRVIGTVIATALFPPLSKAYRRALDLFAVVADRSLELTITILLPGTIGLIVIGDDLLALIFGNNEFADAFAVLRLLALGALFMAIASIMGRVLMAADRETVTLRISVINTVVLIAASVPLTIAFGLEGAAAAALAIALLNVVQHYVPTRRLAPSLSIVRASWKALVGSLAMAGVLFALDGLPVLWRVVIAAVVYLAAVATVFVVDAGGRAQLMDRWRLAD